MNEELKFELKKIKNQKLYLQIMINIKDLDKIYRTEEIKTLALSKIKLHVKQGEFVAVMGLGLWKIYFAQYYRIAR